MKSMDIIEEVNSHGARSTANCAANYYLCREISLRSPFHFSGVHFRSERNPADGAVSYYGHCGVVHCCEVQCGAVRRGAVSQLCIQLQTLASTSSGSTPAPEPVELLEPPTFLRYSGRCWRLTNFSVLSVYWSQLHEICLFVH